MTTGNKNRLIEIVKGYVLIITASLLASWLSFKAFKYLHLFMHGGAL